MAKQPHFTLLDISFALYLFNTITTPLRTFPIFPNMLKNIGPAAVRWCLQSFYDDVIITAKIPKIWRSANVISIRKHGKPLDEPTSYRPISLLCCCYKLLERLLLRRLAPVFEIGIPPEQAGFRKKRNICNQVLALTSYIESGFQKNLKTGAVLIDLSAAHDTVWQAGCMMKLSKLTSLQTMRWSLDMLMTGPFPHNERHFHIFRVHWLLLSTTTLDIGHVNGWFGYWTLRLNAKKNVATCFHLNYKQAARKESDPSGRSACTRLCTKVHRCNSWSVTYRKHTENVRDKVKSRCTIISKLAGTDWVWGAPAPELRTSAIALAHSVAY